ncbi:hypothetical protein MMPV_003064 [Pyropia vietnamensis]
MVRAIVMWHNPVRSGTLFTAGLALFYLTTVRGLSVLSVASLLTAAGLIGRLAVSSARRALSDASSSAHPTAHSGEPFFRPDVVAAWATAAGDTGNEIAEDLAPVLSGTDPAATGRAVACLAATYALGRFVSDGVLAAAAWIAAFTLPSVYTWKQAEIDRAVEGLAAGVRGGVARGVDGVGGHVATARAALAEGGEAAGWAARATGVRGECGTRARGGGEGRRGQVTLRGKEGGRRCTHAADECMCCEDRAPCPLMGGGAQHVCVRRWVVGRVLAWRGHPGRGRGGRWHCGCCHRWRWRDAWRTGGVTRNTGGWRHALPHLW